jgi:hypothetical protein
MSAGSGGVGKQRREPLHPPVDGDMVDLDPALGEQFLDITVRQPVAQVPADRQHDHIGREAKAGEGRPCRGTKARAVSSHADSLAARTQSPPMQQCLWRRAQAFFAGHNITVRRVLTDNGPGYRSRAFAAALAEHQVGHSWTRPYRPQTNGKVERFNRTLLEEWAYRRSYRSQTARARALPAWVHRYNHHRAHTALGGRPPVSRVTNLPGYYT